MNILPKYREGGGDRAGYGIRQIEMYGEKLSDDSEAVVQFCKKLQEVVKKEKLTNDQLYNCDETGLNLKLLPSKTLASMRRSNVFKQKTIDNYFKI